MRTSNRWLPLIACSSILAGPLNAATIQSFGIAPNNPLPGDLVTAFFQVDGSIPVGAAGVWIDGIEQCQALPDNGYYSCAFSVPHGGRFNYELRFHDTNGVLTTSTQQALSGALRIVKFQPEIVQAGRSSVIFAKLDYFHPAASPQPQGQIEIVSLDGAQRCTIQLPQQTHCQILFSQAGRYTLRAQYSGDANYPALTSAVSEILVANPKLDHVIYANEVPLGPIVAGNPNPQSMNYGTGPNSYFNWYPTGTDGTIDYNVGAAIPLFNSSAAFQYFYGPSAVYSSTPEASYATTPRGEQSPLNNQGTIRALSAMKNELVYTDVALSALDTNHRPDWYRRQTNSYNYDWLSKKADGTALSQGLPEFLLWNSLPQVLFNADTIVFNSDENGIVADDQDGLPDTFFARAGHPTIRLPLPANRKSSTQPIAINSSSTQLLFDSALALTPDDMDNSTDTYSYDLTTLQYRRIFNFTANGNISTLRFAPDGSVVGRKYANNSLIVRPPAGPIRELALLPARSNLGLYGVSSTGKALLFDANSQFEIDLTTGAEQVRFGRVIGDEAILPARNLSLNESGSRLLTFTQSGLLAINADGSSRNTLSATEIRTIQMDDEGSAFAFSTFAALLPEDTNQVEDVYEWNQNSGQLRRLTRRPDGTQTTQWSHILAYSRRAGIALVAMRSPDLTLANGGLNLARIDLRSGAVTAVTGVPAVPIEYYHVALDASRNARWAVMPTDEGVVRVDSQNGATTWLKNVYGLEGVINASISDDGDRMVYTHRRDNLMEVSLLDFATNGITSLLQTPDNDVEVRISADGRQALIGTRRHFEPLPILPPPPPTPDKLFIVDLERGLMSEQIASTLDNAFDFSGDGRMIAWANFSGNEQTGGITMRENPYYKLPSYSAIIRTLPIQPSLAQDFLVEAVVSHKETGPAPSGIVRFDDGNGAQCDGELIAQGEVAIARCRILPNAQGLYTRLQSAPPSNSPLALSLTASYLGDRRYSASQGIRSVNVSKVTPTLRWLVAYPSTVPEVSVGIEIDALAGTAFTGSARIASNFGIPCFLSAVEILAAKRCRFFIPYPDSYAFSVTLNDPIYTLGTGSSTYLNVGTSDVLFANGFE